MSVLLLESTQAIIAQLCSTRPGPTVHTLDFNPFLISDDGSGWALPPPSPARWSRRWWSMKFVELLSRAASSGPIQRHSLAQILLSCLAGDRLRHLLPATHARSVVTESLADLFLTNLLLRGYSKLGRLRDARHLFDRMPHRNLVSWSLAISMHAQHGGDDAIALFAAFRKASYEGPNEFLLASALRACTQSRAVSFGEQVHGIAVKLDLCSAEPSIKPFSASQNYLLSSLTWQRRERPWCKLQPTTKKKRASSQQRPTELVPAEQQGKLQDKPSVDRFG